MAVTDGDIAQSLKAALKDHPQFDPATVDSFLASQTSTTQPDASKQPCYDKCAADRNAAYAAALRLGNPIAIALALVAAVTAFNACRAACDQS